MPTETKTRTGFLTSIRALADGLLGMLQDRVELISIELREEKLRLVRILLWIGAVMFSGVMAVAFASITLVCYFWESARMEVLGGITLLYVGVFVAVCLCFRRYLARQPAPFEATLQELGKDRACIPPKN